MSVTTVESLNDKAGGGEAAAAISAAFATAATGQWSEPRRVRRRPRLVASFC